LREPTLDEGDPERPPATVVLSAVDPANPYGAIIPWPKLGEARPPFTRSAGAFVVLVDGELAAYIARGERSIVTLLPEHEPRRSAWSRGLAEALAAWSTRRRQYQPGWLTVNESPITRSSLFGYLREVGFAASGPSVRLVGASRTAPSTLVVGAD
jgi:ATP-dependent Lhr-like helicase